MQEAKNLTMTVSFTSVAAYRSIASSRAVQCERLLTVYETAGALSDRDAAEILNWNPSEVSARRNDLMKDGRKVFELATQKDKHTHKTVKVWGVARESLF